MKLTGNFKGAVKGMKPDFFWVGKAGLGRGLQTLFFEC